MAMKNISQKRRPGIEVPSHSVSPSDEDSHLRVIGKMAFCGCASLKMIDFPDSVEDIRMGAFQESGMESFTAPKYLKVMHQSVFADCESLKHVQLNEGLEVFGVDRYLDDPLFPGVFEGSALESIILSSTLKRIACSAFEDCKNLKNIEFPDGLESIGMRAFANCGLESVTFPASLRTLPQEAFTDCTNLKKVVLNEGLEVLGTDDYPIEDGVWNGVFYGSALESIVLPSTLKRIEYSTFVNCKNLTSIEFPEGLEFIGKAAFAASGVQSVTFPGSLRVLGLTAFTNCKALKTVKFSEGLEVLGANV